MNDKKKTTTETDSIFFYFAGLIFGQRLPAERKQFKYEMQEATEKSYLEVCVHRGWLKRVDNHYELTYLGALIALGFLPYDEEENSDE